MSWAKRAASAAARRVKEMPGKSIEGLKEPGLIRKSDTPGFDNLFSRYDMTSRGRYAVGAAGAAYGLYLFDDADSKAVENRAEMTNEIQSIQGTRADQVNYQAFGGRTIRGARQDDESLVFAMHKLRHTGYMG